MNNAREEVSLKKEVFAGYCSGFFAVLGFMPIEICKVRIQRGSSIGFMRTGLSIIRNEGVLTLWKGSSLPFLFSSIVNTAQFTAYNICFDYFSRKRQNNKLPFTERYASAFSGAILTTNIITFSEHLRIKMQSNYKRKYQFESIRDLIGKVYKRNGIRGFFHGYCITTLRVCIQQPLAYTIFSYLKEYNERRSKVFIPLFGVISGVLSWSFVFIIDNIKTRLQSDCLYEPQFTSSRDIIKKIPFIELTSGYYTGAFRYSIFFLITLTTNTAVRGYLYKH